MNKLTTEVLLSEDETALLNHLKTITANTFFSLGIRYGLEDITPVKFQAMVLGLLAIYAETPHEVEFNIGTEGIALLLKLKK